MKIRILHIFLALLLTLTGFKTLLGWGQAHVAVDLSRRSVYVQQPFRVNITVYTTTWFTAPLEFGNLQIPGAFIVPFDNSQPGIFTVGGKQYPGVQFYFIVFPYKVGSYSIPPLEITATSPPEGSSTGKKVMLHTPEEKFEVKDVPDKLKEHGSWFVAKGLSIRESWDRDLSSLKVGDVIKRTLTVDARGTLPQFIPNLTEQEQVKWASVYPQPAVLTDMRSESDANGRSVQQATYLLEKPGDFVIPSIEVAYWNPNSIKIFSEKTPERKIHVAENPHLGILTTLKDSLDATLSTAPQAERKGPITIFGLRLRALIPLAILLLFALYLAARLCVRAAAKIKEWWRQYLLSEKYLFRKFMRSTDEPARLLSALYRWWDRREPKPSASIGASLDAEGMQQDGAEVKEILSNAFSGKQANFSKLKKVMQAQRRGKGSTKR